MYIVLSLVCGIIIFVLFCSDRPRRDDRRHDVRHEIRRGGGSRFRLSTKVINGTPTYARLPDHTII